MNNRKDLGLMESNIPRLVDEIAIEPKPVPQPTPHYSFLDNPHCMGVDLTQADIDYFNSLRDWR